MIQKSFYKTDRYIHSPSFKQFSSAVSDSWDKQSLSKSSQDLVHSLENVFRHNLLQEGDVAL